MHSMIRRREFLAAGAAPVIAAAAPLAKVRIGIVGTGGRGTSLMRVLLKIENVEVPALCDVNKANLERAQDFVVKGGRAKPEGYTGGDEVYRKLMARDDIDAVIIATPWELHASMAVQAMKSGKYAGVEVPAALTVQECWDLVNTSEQTKIPCMMLENWSFRRDNLAVLNMIRRGLFGEIVHCHCAHSHNCLYWYFDENGNPRWSAQHLIRRNADQYPTHSVGPVLSWMDINCGDSFAYITSMASRSLGINLGLAKKHGKDFSGAKRKYAQGDIVTSLVKTQKGNTLVINNDMQLTRPYDNRWMIQGTQGVYSEDRNSVYIDGRSPQYEKWEPFGPYQEEFNHAWHKELQGRAKGAGHDGTDYLELAKFVEAVRTRSQTPIDVYDSVTMSVIIPLSELSIAKGSAPVACPDFTRGAWKTRKPYFAVEG